ncbi:MAG: hypothetical protein AB7W47_17800 [Calditrichaceae bacterium]
MNNNIAPDRSGAGTSAPGKVTLFRGRSHSPGKRYFSRRKHHLTPGEGVKAGGKGYRFTGEPHILTGEGPSPPGEEKVSPGKSASLTGNAKI